MRTKKHIASTMLCCAALAIPIFSLSSAHITAYAYDYSTVVEQSVDAENEYYAFSDSKLVTKKAGYYAIVTDYGNGWYSSDIGGTVMEFSSIEEAVDAYYTNGAIVEYAEGDTFKSINSSAAVFYVVYSADGATTEAVLKVAADGVSDDEEVVVDVPTPQFRVRYDEAASAVRSDGAAVYTVRAKIDYDVFESWDDIAVPDGELSMLSEVSCRADLADDGTRAVPSIEGFDVGTTYDEFQLYFFENEIYTLYVTDSFGNFSYLEFEVTEVSDELVVEDPYEGVDLKAPELTIEMPTETNVPEGSIVQVKVYSNEPCVMIIGGESFGTIDNPVTEATFEALYNGRFTVIATDISANTTQKAFTVANFVGENSEDSDGGTPNGDNPYNPDDRDDYWEVADLNDVSHVDSNGSNAGKLPQTGENAVEKDNVSKPLIAGVVCTSLATAGAVFFTFRKKLFKRGGAK